MNISLPEKLEAWIDDRVKSGMYQSVSEVVREALRLLHEKEELKQLRIQELRGQLKAGVDQLDAGSASALDQHAVSAIKAKGRRRRTKKSNA